MAEDERFEHPSFGLISLSRVSGRGRLFGSSVEHMHYLELKISRARMQRSLHQDHYYSLEPLIEIALSPSQLSDMLTGMNVGEGTPCTLTRIMDGEQYVGVEPPPDGSSSTTKTYVDEFRERIQQLTQDAKAIAIEAALIAEKDHPSKTERRALSERIRLMIQEIDHNMPFVLEQYVERVEQVTSEARAEIESFMSLVAGDRQRPALADREGEQQPR